MKKGEKWEWSRIGTVMELKFKVDIFRDDGNDQDPASYFIKSEAASEALVQLAKSARSLLMASRNCFVFVIAIFGIEENAKARLFRFDHAGYRVSTAFPWLEEPKVFARFFYGLYNPTQADVDMHGGDETISLPTPVEKKRMLKLLKTNPLYKDSSSKATANSRWVRAAKKDEKGNSVEVRCFTVGPPLSQSDGLFSRATRVDRVLIENDTALQVYALKDSWKQVALRPEIDFYDVIAQYCKEEDINMVDIGMAQCHGSLDLSAKNRTSHLTCLAAYENIQRCHMRTLLTPVGVPLKEFASTKQLVAALRNAIRHHEIALAAGVMHRDVSEGNVLFNEAALELKTDDHLKIQGFLVDWDYAAFTVQGLENFNKLRGYDGKVSPEGYQLINKGLKDLTGTFAFLAIQILEASTKGGIAHEACHDLESFYWLLTWMILRHTAHVHYDENLACHELFDARTDKQAAVRKANWITQLTPLPKLPLLGLVGLRHLAEALRRMVELQNPVVREYDSLLLSDAPSTPTSSKPMTHADILNFFDRVLALPWLNDPKAQVFVAPSTTTQAKEERGTASSLIKEAIKQDSANKRSRPDSGFAFESTASAASSSGAGSSSSARSDDSRKRARRKAPKGVEVDEETPKAWPSTEGMGQGRASPTPRNSQRN
ncbi:hypothetical protein C8J57DRAFT_365997 [Mycena rebaudengoi]|nr:hypothetical protein C8J57DRAFT_365997 [Mycena rebaudengoi]